MAWSQAASFAAKRAFDVCFSLLALTVFSPLLAVIALAVKLDSPGPVLFRQYRVGRNNRTFGMLKFRTMVDGADRQQAALAHLNESEGGLFKIRDDPRVTRVGAFLRSTSLDELPQLLDVLRGSMSLVGPRPLVPEEDSLISGEYRRRLEVRPGMTGPWQVAGATKIPLGAMAALDLEYVTEHSLALDALLIVRTVPHVLLRRGV